MKSLKSLLLVAALQLVSASGQAATLSVQPQAASVAVGASFDVDLYINLDQSESLNYLGAFDVDLGFNADKMTLTSLTFGGKLGDTSVGESLADYTVGGGVVNLYEASLLESDSTNCVFCLAPYLADLQSSASFKLATLQFSALASGSSDFALTVNALADGFGDNVVATELTINDAQLTAVPLPAAVWLFASMLPLIGFRKS
ncbi:hypothetical protein [Methylomonas albis]|uniref:Cohesin domain-containing protein n=1 Tax=Methylomonas albis TaxID=1854563 RepID=A0ABR9D3N1_9GAMM|nr:cohesin domain-containing protein [Methylomonas albis]MBD9357535.1 hypothetical protein [Methylomonas albis]CAD6880818.1 hypothetical protein [Methylomonas albis]